LKLSLTPCTFKKFSQKKDFDAWFNDSKHDDVPGKKNALFQLVHWIPWIRSCTSPDGSESQQDSQEEEDDDDDEVDFEANIPKRSNVPYAVV